MRVCRASFFERADPLAKVELQLGGLRGLHEVDRRAVPIGRSQGGDVRQPREPVGPGPDRHHRVEAQQREVCQVVARQGLVVHVRVDAAQAA